MNLCKFKLCKVKSCVYEVWAVDAYGILTQPVGEVGKYSELCKYDHFYSDYVVFQGLADWMWVFFSFQFGYHIFPDYISAFRYARCLWSGE